MSDFIEVTERNDEAGYSRYIFLSKETIVLVEEPIGNDLVTIHYRLGNEIKNVTVCESFNDVVLDIKY